MPDSTIKRVDRRQIHQVAVALGQMGGRARSDKMTPEQRSESARKAVMARWAKARQKARGTQ